MTPPYFSTSAYPSYSTTNGFNPQNQNYASIPSSSYQNFRFKNVPLNDASSIGLENYSGKNLNIESNNKQKTHNEVNNNDINMNNADLISNSGLKAQEEYVLVPTPVDYDQFMKMQYSKEFAKFDNLNGNVLPSNQEQMGLIDSKYKELYSSFGPNMMNVSMDSIKNSTLFNSINKNIYKELNESEQKKLLNDFPSNLALQPTRQNTEDVMSNSNNKSFKNSNSNNNFVGNKSDFFDTSSIKFVELNSNGNINNLNPQKQSSIKSIENSNFLREQIDPQKFIKLQEDEYHNLFEKINKIEYEKVYNSLNNQKFEKDIYEKIQNSEGELDFSEVWKNFQGSQIVNPATGMPINDPAQGPIPNSNSTSSEFNATDIAFLQKNSFKSSQKLPYAENPYDIQSSLNSIKLETNPFIHSQVNSNFNSNPNSKFSLSGVFSLPENREQVEQLYQNFFSNINTNNTNVGISSLHAKENYQKTDLKAQEASKHVSAEYMQAAQVGNYIDSSIPKSQVFSPAENKNIKNDFHLIHQNSEEEQKIKIKKIIDEELNEKLFEAFHRKKNLREYEKNRPEEGKKEGKTSKQENEKTIKNNKYNKNLIKPIAQKSFSFMQKQSLDGSELIEQGKFEDFQESSTAKNNSNISALFSPNKDATVKRNLDSLISQVRSKIVGKKMKIKENLINCKRNCDAICKRVISLGKKSESNDLCIAKCELACSNNALNILLK